MATFLVRRLLRAGLTLWFVVSVVFVVTRASGDPTLFLLPPDASNAERAALRSFLGLDRSLGAQYLTYAGQVVRLEFGNSFYYQRPARDVFVESLPRTLELTALAFGLSFVLGTTAGIAAARWRDGPADRLLMLSAFVGYALPNFVLGITLILVFSLVLRWLPSGGSGTPWHLVMPALTLASSGAAALARYTRSALLDVLGTDYLRTARGKGVAPRGVLLKHALRNAAIPIITILGLQVGTLIAGTVVVETVFAWPGTGRLIVTAVRSQDYPLVQFSVIAIAASVTLANLVVDALYAVIDPRVRRPD